MAAVTSAGPDPTLYLYTSLTAGSSHIITATSRLETILKANKIAFRAIDCATDEKARNLWSRRSKGRKIPGLVKYGQVIGDLEEVEEWNEYGEINENIDNVSDIFGDTPMTDTPMPPPAPITLKDPLAKPDPPSRSSSETRHISISEPSRDRSGSPGSSARTSKDESPMNMAMRQAGAEAAAKAGQRKASGLSSLKASSTASTIPAKRDATDTTPNASATKMSLDAEEPANAPEITAGKAPTQLAAEGAKKASVDKIAETGSGDTSATSSDSESMSNEEQMLEARRHSSIAKAPSRLHQEMSVDDIKSPKAEEAIGSEINLPGQITSNSEQRPSHHRGSSLSEASKEEIREIERKNAIQEESEEEGSGADTKGSKITEPVSKSTVQATDQGEADVMKGSKPQDQKAKDVDAAGVSAANALFLSPNSTANPNRLSADSASVYSFFDSAFSPAPLFSGSKNLDLDLSFMQELGQADPRASVDTYKTNTTKLSGIHQSRDESINHHTPRASQDTKFTEHKRHEQDGSPRREILPSMPAIAPLRTPARRQVSEPLLSSTLNLVSTPTSIPLPLTIRKSPTNPISNDSPTNSPTSTPRPASRSQPHLLTTPTSNSHFDLSQSPHSPVSPITSPSTNTTPTSASATESRSLRFKKSIRSLRSKKSTQRLNTFDPASPGAESGPPSLPIGTARQLREIAPNTMSRSVSDSFAVAGEKKRREKSGVKNLLCF